MNIMKEAAILTAGITGFNLPDGCHVNDIPGCSKEDRDNDIKIAVFENVIEAIEKVFQDMIIDGFYNFTMESEDALKSEIIKKIMYNTELVLGI